jgi:hypothetical protein
VAALRLNKVNNQSFNGMFLESVREELRTGLRNAQGVITRWGTAPLIERLRVATSG